MLALGAARLVLATCSLGIAGTWCTRDKKETIGSTGSVQDQPDNGDPPSKILGDPFVTHIAVGSFRFLLSQSPGDSITWR